MSFINDYSTRHVRGTGRNSSGWEMRHGKIKWFSHQQTVLLGWVEENSKVGENILRLSIATLAGLQSFYYLTSCVEEMLMPFLTNFSKDKGSLLAISTSSNICLSSTTQIECSFCQQLGVFVFEASWI